MYPKYALNVAATRCLLSLVERSASRTASTSSSTLWSSRARYRSSLPGKCWYRTGLLTPARSAISSMAAAWYPCVTNTSSAASRSCRRRSCLGSRVLRGRASDVAVKVRSRLAAHHYIPNSTHPKPRSAVVVIVEADRPGLLGRVRLVHVEPGVAPRNGHDLASQVIRDQFPVLLDGIVFGRLQPQFAQRPDPLSLRTGGPRAGRPRTGGPRTGGQVAERGLQRFPVRGKGVHHVGQDGHRYFCPDGERNLRHPGGRVRPHRHGADQHPVGRVKLEPAQVIATQTAPGGVAQRDSRHRKTGPGRFAHGVDRRRGVHAPGDRAVVRLAGLAEEVGRDYAGLVAAG